LFDFVDRTPFYRLFNAEEDARFSRVSIWIEKDCEKNAQRPSLVGQQATTAFIFPTTCV
jgi:hypothetical protein